MTIFSSQRPLLIALLAIGSFVGLLSARMRADEPKGKATEIDGVWRFVSVETDEETRKLEEDVRWTVKEGKVFYEGETLATFVVYPASTPKGLDLAFLDPKKEQEGIYKIEKDTLTICVNSQTEGAKDRPSDFSTKDKPSSRLLTLRRVMSDEKPERKRGFIGIALAAEEEKVVVQSALDNSPAKKAGLAAGDVILTIGGEKVANLLGAVNAVRREPPGGEIKLVVRRDEKEKEITVKVGVFPFGFFGFFD